MMKGKWALTHASSLQAEALIEQMVAAGIAAQDVVLLDEEQQVGNRLSYADTYIETLDQTEFDYEGLSAILLLQQDEELESLLQHAECFVISHYYQGNIQPVYVPTISADFDWSEAQHVKLAGAECSTLMSLLNPLQAAISINSVQITNVLSASFLGKTSIENLATQTISLLNGRQPDVEASQLPLAFNMQPVVDQSRMALHLSNMLGGEIRCTMQSLLAPAFHGLMSSVMLEVDEDIDEQAIKSAFSDIAGVELSDQQVSPMSHCQQDGTVFITSLQQSGADSKRVQLWVISDSFRNGLMKNYLQAMKCISESLK